VSCCLFREDNMAVTVCFVVCCLHSHIPIVINTDLLVYLALLTCLVNIHKSPMIIVCKLKELVTFALAFVETCAHVLAVSFSPFCPSPTGDPTNGRPAINQKPEMTVRAATPFMSVLASFDHPRTWAVSTAREHGCPK